MAWTNASGDISIGAIVDNMYKIEDMSSTSLTQATKRCTINSRVFIEKQLGDEEILTPLMLNIMNLYTGLILTAVSMNRYITGTRKVRDAMSVVATEGLNQMPQFTDDQLRAFALGNNDPFYIPKSTRMSLGDILDDNPDPADDTSEPTKINATSGSKVIDPEPKNANLPSGRIIEINFGPSGSKGGDINVNQSFTVNMMLQLMPTFVPTDVAEAFIGMNFTPTLKQRWMQASAGEISFISDLIFSQDIRRKRMKALKNDKSGALSDMIERQENSLSNTWLKLLQVMPERQNIANTILIFEKRTFDKACSRAGLNFKNYSQRQKFFTKTFAMIMCTIDPLYNNVDMFYHGLETFSTFKFEQVKRNAKTDNVDLMSVMKAYSQGMAPKY